MRASGVRATGVSAFAKHLGSILERSARRGLRAGRDGVRGRRARAREPPLVRGRRWPPGRPPVHRAPQHVQAEGPAEEGGGALRDVRKRRGDPGGVVRAGPAPDARRRGRRVLWAEAVHGDVRLAPHHVHTEQVRPARERRERHLHAGGVQRGRRREDAVRRARSGVSRVARQRRRPGGILPSNARAERLRVRVAVRLGRFQPMEARGLQHRADQSGVHAHGVHVAVQRGPAAVGEEVHRRV
mmetsp:Transcript_490/g.1826  ORF Transcript_490/g.1826 Transcript_490/m.1826 type:complete len:242 (+) Transcript_490:215-940(+)